ncbi:MFS transporter [Candidatus Micrarchaeota archaeon]|nr:MFS transporter [Candidatus Micrarchaeota archaeon]
MPKKAFDIYNTLSVLYAGTFAFMAGLFSLILIEKGLDLPAIALYFAIYSFSVLVFEVPTGAFADVYGRKKAIVIGFMLQIVFLAGFVFLPGGFLFTGFAIIVALADSLMSGTAEAYAVDMLAERGKMDYTHKLLSTANTWKFTLFLAGSIIGGFVGSYSLIYAAALCIPFAVAGLLYSWFALQDDHGKRSLEASERTIMSKMARSFAESTKHPALGAIYALSVLMGFGSFGLFLYWPIVMQSLAGWDAAAVGIFFAIISLVVILGAKASAFFKPDWATVAFLMLGMAVTLALASWLALPIAIALMILLWEALLAVYQPIENAIVNHNTTSSIRATTISVKSLFFRMGCTVLGGIIAIFGLGDPRSLWTLGSAFLLLGAVLAAFAVMKKLPSATGISAK